MTPSERKRAYWKLGVDGADENRAREEARDEIAGEQQEDCADGVGEIGHRMTVMSDAVRVGGVEGGDADDEARARRIPRRRVRVEQHGGAVRRRPVLDVGDAGDGVAAGETLIESHGGEDAAQQRGEGSADQGKQKYGEQQATRPGRKLASLYSARWADWLSA